MLKPIAFALSLLLAGPAFAEAKAPAATASTPVPLMWTACDADN